MKRYSLINSVKQLPRLVIYIPVAGLLCLLLVYWLSTPLSWDWESRFQSNHYLLRSAFSEPQISPLPMVVILIDDNSLPKGKARSPVDRQWLAGLLDKISQRQPELIALNILLDSFSTDKADRELNQAIRQSGKVIIRDDPLYPARPLFADAALSQGSIRFRFDSAGTVQEVCNSPASCKSSRILHHQIWQHFGTMNGSANTQIQPQGPWLKINFTESRAQQQDGQRTHYPVIRAHDVDGLASDALKGKLVLIGSGLSDIYPLFRIPIDWPQRELQETEILGQLLHMMASHRYLLPVKGIWVSLLFFGLMILASAILQFRGMTSAVLFSVLSILTYYIICSVGFAYFNLEIPFILPVVLLVLFLTAGILIESARERIFRLSLELQLKQNKIDFLTNELHTHHLFNEFARISVMIKQNPEAAREYLIEFAEMLRLSLKFGDQPRVHLHTQIEYIQSFISQQKIVHQDQIIFNLDLDEKLEAYFAAPWHVFFPLVENAVKYATAYLKKHPDHPSHVSIRMTASNGQVEFSVENPFDSTVTISSRTGLNNLKNRLANAYPKSNFKLESYAKEPGRWFARLQIPVT